MEEQSQKDKMRDAIMEVLNHGFQNPKGKYIHMTTAVIWQDVRQQIPCAREDIIRELEYLDAHGWIKKQSKTTKASSFRGKPFSLTTEYYKLSEKGQDLFEHKGKYSKKDVSWTTKLPTVNMQGSTFNAPVTIGDNNIVNSYNTTNDIAKIVELIEGKQGITDVQKEELKQIIESELEPILKSPNLTQSKTLIDKLKSLGQTWIAPVITQIIAAYLCYHLGIPPSQMPQGLNSPYIA